MIENWFKKLLAPCLVLGIFGAAVFSEFTISPVASNWMRRTGSEIRAAAQDASVQWMVVVCLFGYFIAFLILERRLPQRGTEGAFAFVAFFRGHICNPNLWLVGFVVLVLLRYAMDYADAAKSLQVVVLLTGIVIGKAAALWVEWGDSKSRHLTQIPHPQPLSHPLGEGGIGLSPVEAERVEKHPTSNFQLSSINRTQVVLLGLVFLLAVAALWQPEIGMEFYYRGIRRWEGIWDNPNIYGVLMGVGLTLAIGLIGTGVWRLVIGEGAGLMSRTLLALLFAAAGVCGFGLLKSYSRGAWLGTGIALIWLIGFWVWRLGSTSARVLSLRRNWLPLLVILASSFTICFWQLRHTESPLLRRVFSVGNVNDFSWRNRVTAWHGAGRMIFDKPLRGFGWGQAEEIYGKEYRAARLDESAAIQLNDYLTLGISVGVPALVCLVIYISLIGRPVSRAARCRLSEPSTHNLQLSIAAAAGTLVLLIGFWFDGGLFKLPTCVVFWVLLELARVPPLAVHRPPSPHPMGRGQGEGRQHISLSRSQVALRWLAGVAAVLAIGQTALHLGIPQFAVNERTLSIARNRLVPARERADFEFLAVKEIWSGRSLKVLLQHAHLANYNRELVNWKLDVSIYQQYVLSPEIDPTFDGAMNWRRPLWEYFYPRIRKETSLTAAAETVMRHLREQVRITPAGSSPKTIAELWQQERADAAGFEAVCIAALRSVGIPARSSVRGQAEFWNGDEWKFASGNSVP